MFEPEGCFPARSDASGAAATVVPHREALSQCFFSSGLQLLLGAQAPIGVTLLQQLHGMVTVELKPVGLAERTFVPVQPDPSHPVQDGVNRLLRGAASVRILDAKNERAPFVPSEEPVKQSGSDSADVQVSGRTRRKSYSNVAHHRTSSDFSNVMVRMSIIPRAGCKADYGTRL